MCLIRAQVDVYVTPGSYGAFSEHACLATESANSFLKMLLCPGIHCMVICLLSSLRLNLRVSRPADFLSRAAHRDWESVNTATKEFWGTPVRNQCTASSRALYSRRNK